MSSISHSPQKCSVNVKLGNVVWSFQYWNVTPTIPFKHFSRDRWYCTTWMTELLFCKLLMIVNDSFIRLPNKTPCFFSISHWNAIFTKQSTKKQQKVLWISPYKTPHNNSNKNMWSKLEYNLLPNYSKIDFFTNHKNSLTKRRNCQYV